MLLQGAADVVLAVDHHPAAVDLDPLQDGGASRNSASTPAVRRSRRHAHAVVIGPAVELLAEQLVVGGIGSSFASGNSFSANARNALSNSGLPQQASANSRPPVSRLDRRFSELVGREAEALAAVHVQELVVEQRPGRSGRSSSVLQGHVEPASCAQVVHQVAHRPRGRLPVALVPELGHLEEAARHACGSSLPSATSTCVRRGWGGSMPVA